MTTTPTSEIATSVDAARLELAREIALEAGQFTLKYFRNPDLDVERKGDGTPVTLADRGAEELLRERIAAAFPDDGILGEEYPETPGTSGRKWILDPIDGTKPFVHGVPLYTNLIAVLDEATGEPVLGVINAPASGEMIHALVGHGAWYQYGDRPAVRAQVSSAATLSEGLFLTGDVGGFQDRDPDTTDVYFSLQQAARISRTWGDGYGYMMVAIGRAELMVDAQMSLWDAACLKPILEEAGGTFTSWSGEPTVHAGEGIATNGHVLAEVLAKTRGR
ncbi:inositol monophosphatase family protein [Botrimarina hoheduenensis]|uniref:Histidinol-phosphatase n=1 Tax=Botrimarina hoheduenensis TaxID=2528000 RepID=A0A5C5VWD2_9BACT|nr:inositol monophosphatase family protein [Botrimarina hoheduenensis]TWT42928.1 Histidinol-phosphatase [Botrimarina hoheduenensis]